MRRDLPSPRLTRPSTACPRHDPRILLSFKFFSRPLTTPRPDPCERYDHAGCDFGAPQTTRSWRTRATSAIGYCRHGVVHVEDLAIPTPLDVRPRFVESLFDLDPSEIERSRSPRPRRSLRRALTIMTAERRKTGPQNWANESHVAVPQVFLCGRLRTGVDERSMRIRTRKPNTPRVDCPPRRTLWVDHPPRPPSSTHRALRAHGCTPIPDRTPTTIAEPERTISVKVELRRSRLASLRTARG